MAQIQPTVKNDHFVLTAPILTMFCCSREPWSSFSNYMFLLIACRMLRMVRFFCLARPSASGTQKTSGSVKLRSYAGQAVADVIKQFFLTFGGAISAISFVSSGAKKMKSATQHILTPRTIKQQSFRSPG